MPVDPGAASLQSSFSTMVLYITPSYPERHNIGLPIRSCNRYHSWLINEDARHSLHRPREELEPQDSFLSLISLALSRSSVRFHSGVKLDEVAVSRYKDVIYST